MQLGNTLENPYERYDSLVKCKLPNLSQGMDNNLNKPIATKERLIAFRKDTRLITREKSFKKYFEGIDNSHDNELVLAQGTGKGWIASQFSL